MEKELEELKERFLQKYPNVPEALRKEIIVSIEGRTYNWDSVYFEVNNDVDGDLMEKLLKTLASMKII